MGRIAHELMNALTPVLGCAEMLQEHSVRWEREPRELFGMLSQGAQSLYELANNLLTWSRLRDGRVRRARETISVREIVRRVLDRLEPAARSRVTLEDEEKDAGVVSVDPAHAETILGNLISNALRFSPETRPVQVLLRREGDEWHVEVRDEGSGISPGDRGRLFRPFSRSATRRGGGGLGLAVARRLARLHGGEIDCKSRVGKGARFIWRLSSRGMKSHG